MLKFIFQDGEIIIKDTIIVKNLSKNSKVLKSMIKDNKLNEEGSLEVPFNSITKEQFQNFSTFCVYTPIINSLNVLKYLPKLVDVIETINYLEFDNFNTRDIFENIYYLLKFYEYKSNSLPFKISLPKLCEMLKFYLTCNESERKLISTTNEKLNLIHYKVHCKLIRNSREEYDKEMSKIQDRIIPYINYSKDTLEKNLEELDIILKTMDESETQHSTIWSCDSSTLVVGDCSYSCNS